MIGALVLAAGRSRRMGTQKLLLPFGGKSLIAHVVDQTLASGVAEVIVVVGTDGPAIAAALADRPVTIVRNPAPDCEMLDSVRCGIRALPEGCEAVLLVLGDQPGLTPALIREIIAAWRASRRGIVVPRHEGRRGHPLLFAATYAPEILAHYDAVGLRGLLQEHSDDVLDLDVADPGVLLDVDLPEDYRRALQSLGTDTPS